MIKFRIRTKKDSKYFYVESKEKGFFEFWKTLDFFYDLKSAEYFFDKKVSAPEEILKESDWIK